MVHPGTPPFSSNIQLASHSPRSSSLDRVSGCCEHNACMRHGGVNLGGRASWGGLRRQAEAQVIYSFLTPHLLSFSTQTPPAFSHSALFFASFNPAKAGAVRAVAAAKVMNAKRSLFM